MFTRSTACLAAAMLTGLVSARTAHAQTADPASQSLRLAISASGGYDTDVTGTGGGSPATTPSAPHAGGRVSLAHQIRTEKMAFSTRGTADYRQYRTKPILSANSYSGSAVFGAQITSRLNVNASVNTGYSPQFVFSLLPAAGDLAPDITPSSLDYAVSDRPVASYAGGANASLRVTRRSSLNVTVTRSEQRLLDDDYKVSTQSYGGGYSYAATRYATLRVGYSEQTAHYPVLRNAPRGRLTQRNFDAGVNYSRPLSLSRRTTVSFGSGSSAIDDGQETFFNVTGNAALNHQIGRTWEANLVYARGLGIVAGFTEPFFADSVNANLRGHVTNRLTALATAGFTNGNIGLGSRANDYASFQASTRLEWVVNRERIAVFSDYFFYAYKFDDAPIALTAIPNRVNRHGMRAGVIVRFPLVKERNPRVTR